MFSTIKRKTKECAEIAVQPTLVDKIRDWLGPDNISYFRSIKKKHGRIDAVWSENGIPHAVHLREGMQIRNKLRELTNYSWTDHEYDNRWVGIIEKAIR